MSQCDVYIGRLSNGDDPLDWGRDPRVGNTPSVIDGTWFPPTSRGTRGISFGAFFQLIEKIEGGQLPGKQIDWGAWAAIVSKADIIAFINEAYQGDRTYSDPNYMPHLYPKLQDLLGVVRELPDGERFAPVACEL